MKKTKKTLAVFLALSALAIGQEKKNDGDEYVRVQKKYVSSEGLARQQPQTAEVSSWIGVGREIGEAMNAGLGAVVDQAERFGTTRVGGFVMAMVAWRIIGKDIIGILIGVPVFIGGMCFIVWSYRRMVFGYSLLLTKEGKNKTYESVPPLFQSSDERAGAALLHALGVALWCIALYNVIF